MATIMLREKHSGMKFRRFKITKTTLLISSIFSVSSIAAPLDFTASVDADAIYQDISSENFGRRSLTTFQVNPRVNALYQSRTFNGLWSGALTHIERDNDDFTQTSDYAEYQYSAQWRAIERLLSFQANGSLNYRNASANNFLVSDFLTRGDDLAKTRTGQISSSLNLDRGDWVRAQGFASYSIVESERAESQSNAALDSETYQTRGSLYQGDEATFLFWSVSGSYSQTDRQNRGNGDLLTRRGEAKADMMVFNNLGFRITGTHEANQLADRTDTFSQKREFSSYGAGLTYRQSDNRYIAVTVNKSESNLREDDNDTFLGLDLQWAFSSRTSLSATYGRRFYGESGSFNLRYNTKKVRASVTYTEQLTSTSRLLANPENLGVFVCPVGSSSISECFQPNSLTYSPNPGEQLVQFTSQNFELDDSIILRKSTNAQLGYDFSRLSLSLSWRYSENDRLEEDRLTRTYGGALNASWKLGSYTNLTASINYADIEQRSVEFDNAHSENWRYSLGLSRELGQHLDVNFNFSLVKQDRESGFSGGRFGNNYTDRRISVGVRYNYN